MTSTTTNIDYFKPSDGMTEKDYDRVTAILFPYSGLTHVDPEILRRAAERGTFFHSALDALIDGFPVPEVPESWQGYKTALLEWWELNKENTFEKIPRVFDHGTMITGEPDIVMVKNGKRILVDLKTSLNEGKTWSLQGAAYAEFLRLIERPVDDVIFVQIKRTGQFQEFNYAEFSEQYLDFLDCAVLYRKFFKDDSRSELTEDL